MCSKVGVLIALIFMVSVMAQAQSVTSAPQYINYAAFLPNGNLLTVGSETINLNKGFGRFHGDTLTLWDPGTGAQLARQTLSRELEECKVSDDGNFVAGWDTHMTDHAVDGAVRLYHTFDNNYYSFGVIGGPTATVMDVAFSPDSSMIAVSYLYVAADNEPESRSDLYKKAIRVFTIDDLMEYCWLTTDEPVDKLAWSVDGKSLGAASETSAYVWNIEAKQKLGKGKNNAPISKIGFLDSTKLVALTKDREVYGFEIPRSPVGSLKGEVLKSAAIPSAIEPGGIGVKETTGGLILIDSKSASELVTVHKVANSRGEIPGEESPESGPRPVPSVLSISRDGNYAVLGSQVLDVKSRTLRDLVLRPPHVPEWAVGPAPERPILQYKFY